MDIQMISVPYDSGYKSTRMGRGPGEFLLNGIGWNLQEAGHQSEVLLVEAAEGFHTEIGTSFELYRLLAARVRSARERGVFPLVLAGNCGSALGALAGLGIDGLGLVWLDAHGDFNTPETTTSGYLDGMALSIATGHCWRNMAASIPGIKPLPEELVLHIGARQLDPVEQDLLTQSAICMVSAERLQSEGPHQALAAALANLRARVQKVYLHIDLDVLDPAIAPANSYSPPGGLTVDQAQEVVCMIHENFQIVSAGIASYDPEVDQERRALRAAYRMVKYMVSGKSC